MERRSISTKLMEKLSRTPVLNHLINLFINKIPSKDVIYPKFLNFSTRKLNISLISMMSLLKYIN